MNILPSTGPDPVGAVTLLTHADTVELERFQILEDAIWGGTSLAPAVIESVRGADPASGHRGGARGAVRAAARSAGLD